MHRFNRPSSSMNYPDNKEAAKILIDPSEVAVLKKTYAETLKTCANKEQIIEEPPSTEEKTEGIEVESDLQRFRRLNGRLYRENGIWKEKNHMESWSIGEDADTIVLPDPESLFK